MKTETETSKDIRESFPDEWDEWVLVSLTKLESSESAIENSGFIKGLPPWAKSMLEELIKPMLPSIIWELDGQTGPEFLGRLVGHQEYLLESDEAGIAFDHQLLNLDKSVKSIESFYKENYPEEEFEAHSELGEDLAEYWSSGLEHLIDVLEKKSEAIKQCRTRAFEQPFEVSQEFNKAYSQAQSTSLYNEHGNIDRLSNWNKVMLALIIFKPFVEKKEYIKNLPALHKWIVRIHGYPIISFGSFKALCRKHGLKLADRGRPKK